MSVTHLWVKVDGDEFCLFVACDKRLSEIEGARLINDSQPLAIRLLLHPRETHTHTQACSMYGH